jgi:hypothetical protein
MFQMEVTAADVDHEARIPSSLSPIIPSLSRRLFNEVILGPLSGRQMEQRFVPARINDSNQ